MAEEIRMAETEQGDVASNEGESTGEMSNNSRIKRGRGRPQGSRKLKVSVTDVNLVVSGISNGGSTQSPRKRGRPSLTKPTKQEGSGDDQADDSVQTSESKKEASNADSSPKGRGRPRKSVDKNPSEKADVNDLPNGGSDEPKARRGRPKGSTKRKSERLISEENEGSSNKKPRLETQNSKTHRGRGRPRKIIVQTGRGKEELVSGSQPDKRGRGRPKGSLNKKPPAYKVHGKVSQPKRSSPTKEMRGRPRKQPAKRGRPRKYPLPSPEELKKPKVWKPLGRPRKYPRVDPPEGSLPAPRRSRGRPCKVESKKGAHLRLSASSSSPANLIVGSPRKRGRPPSAAKKDAATPRGRGRPKGSVNKNKRASSPVGVEPEAAEVEHHTETPIEHDTETPVKHDSEAAIEHDTETPIEHDTETPIKQDSEDNTEESIIDQDASFEVSNQA